MEYKKLVITKEIDSNEIKIKAKQLIKVMAGNCRPRTAGTLAGKAFFLSEFIGSEKVVWIIARDDVEDLCVIPLLEEK